MDRKSADSGSAGSRNKPKTTDKKVQSPKKKKFNTNKKKKGLKKKVNTRKELRKNQRKEKKAKKHNYILSKVQPKAADSSANADASVQSKRSSKRSRSKNKKVLGTDKSKPISTSTGTGKKPRMSATMSYKSSADKIVVDNEKSLQDAKIARLEQKYSGRYSSSSSSSGGESGTDNEQNSSDESCSESWNKRLTLDSLKEKMGETRRKRLLEENEEEDRHIQSLSKKLKLNKKAVIPESFRTDGLDYLLEICDGKLSKSSEQDHNETAAYLKEKRRAKSEQDKAKDKDGTGTRKSKQIKPTTSESDDDEMSDGDLEQELQGNGSDSEEDDVDDDDLDLEDRVEDTDSEDDGRQAPSGTESDSDSGEDMSGEFSDNEDSLDEDGSDKDKDNKAAHLKVKKGKKCKSGSAADDDDDSKKYWEDIYGRMRDKDGNVVTATTTAAAESGKYVPPAKREEATGSKSRTIIAKSIKGLLNRLTETNMHNIAGQLEQLYMGNSRNEMNECLLELYYSALVRNVQMPERIILEHVMLIAILHANVGTEVGAFFIQSFVQKFHELYKITMAGANNGNSELEESKELENLILLTCFMYHFKIIDSSLIYELLNFVGQTFQSKDIELILTVLRSIGFRLRKDEPLKLKELILLLQKKATETKSKQTSSRVKFMLEILLAIRNNNMTKIPNYDPSFGEHLLKIIKTHLHKGTYVSELKISLQDLLNADAKGRWWIVGSAWSNTAADKLPEGEVAELGESGVPAVPVNEKLLEKAKAQGMNTEIRKNIFCILMTAEDYLDAFEKLMHLGLKNQMEREIVHVIIFCCLQEKKFNLYYSFLLSKLCSIERRFLLTIQYTLWDRLKDLDKLPKIQWTNLTQLLTHLINEKVVPITVLKIIDFTDMDEVKLEFLRNTLTGILLQENTENLQEIFTKLGSSSKFSLFRESLKLFLLHFMLKKRVGDGLDKVGKMSKISPEKFKLLKSRVELVDKIMTAISHGKVQF